MEDRTVLEAKRIGIVSCQPDHLLDQIATRMADEDISALVVVDETGYLEGIITRSDLLRARWVSDDWRQETAARFMTKEVVTVTPDTSLLEVIELLLRHQIHRVVVVREEEQGLRPIAVVSDSDLICELADEVKARGQSAQGRKNEQLVGKI